MRAAAVILAALVGGGCAATATPLAADHPAHPAAPTGRLAGPPAALRPGVAGEARVEPPPPPPTGHDGHGEGAR